MKKRFLSVFMALCMVLGLLPTAAAAADVSSAQMLADALGGAACATVSGDTVTMQQNVTLTDTITITSGTVVLDLNGHTMTGKAGDGSRLDYNYACEKTALAITGGALTIRDSASGGKVIGGNGSGSAYLWADGPVGGGGLSVTGGAVTISGGTLEGGVGGTQTRFIGGRGGFGIFVESGMVSVTGGTFTGGAGGGGGNGSGAQGSAVVINGGSVDGTLGAAPKNDSGTELQLYTLTVNRAVDSPLAGTAVTALTATDKLGYTYGMTGVKTDADGKLYVYLPAGKTAFSVTADRVTYSGSVTENTAALLPPPTAAEYAAASPAAAADTDYVLDTEAKTLAIRTAKGAAFFSANGAAYRGYTVKLDADVDVGGFLWTPVCNLGTPFTGSFDGQNHTISKLTVAAMNGGCAGVFGRVGYSGQTPAAAVKNLTVTGSVNVSGSGSCYVGGIVGYNYGLTTIAPAALR